MRQYNPTEYLFSIHIPKCGGTSFIQVLRQWFWPGFHAHYFDHEAGRMPLKPMLAKQVCHRLGIWPLVVHGHFEEECGVFKTYPKARQFITVIRDPLEMQLSLFFDHKRRLKEHGALFWKGQAVEMEYGGDLDTWVAERPCYMLKFLPWTVTLNDYQDVLNEHFVHIGVMEKIQESINVFSQKLGKRPCEFPHVNQSIRTQEPSIEAIKKFKDKHKLEYEIYNYALALNHGSPLM